MNRLLLYCLLVSINAYGKGTPPFEFNTSNLPFFPIAFVDTIPPTIECPPNTTINLASGECGSVFNYTIIADDDQPGFFVTQLSGLASGSEFPIGVVVNTWAVADQSANTASCSFSVTVVEASANLNCDDFTDIELGANCFATVLPEDVLIGTYGCTDNYSVQIDKIPPFGNGPWVPASVGQADINKTYAYRVVNTSNGSSCLGEIKILDPAPSLVCEDVVINCAVDNLAPAFLVDSLGISTGIPAVVDNCPGFSLMHVDFASNLPCNPFTGISGTVNRIWTVTDDNGSTGTCQQTIFRQRSFNDIEFPPNTTVGCADTDNIGLSGAPVVKVGNRAFPLWPASYCELDLNYNDSLATTGCGGQIVRTWEIFDLCLPASPSNPFTGTQIIDIVDENGPTLECDSSLTVSTDGTDCRGPVDLPDVRLDDDCSPIASIAAYWTADGLPDTLVGTLTVPDTLGVLGVADDFPIGTTTVRYVATDSCGNTGSCDISITVWDMDPPTTGCIAFLTVLLSPDGHFMVGADTLDINSKDSCSQELWFKMRRTLANECEANDQFYDAVLFCCADIGDTIELTRRVYDVAVPDGPVAPNFAAGQFSDCTVKVEVLDTLAVGCTAPPDVVVGCNDFNPLGDYGAPVPNCGVDSMAMTVNYSQYDSTCQSGTVERTFHVFGANGDSSACVQQITISHVQDYYIKFPDDVVTTVCDGVTDFGVPEFVSNGCEILIVTYEDETFDVVPDACFKIERTWKVYNQCTYDSLASLVLVPNPNPDSVSNHPDNLLGPTVMPDTTVGTWSPTVVNINPTDTVPTNYSTFWSLGAAGYQFTQIIKVIDIEKPVVNDCPSASLLFDDITSNDTTLWNQSYWMDANTNSNNLADGAVSLNISASDSCFGSDLNISYLLFLDLDGDDAMETVVDSENPPAPGTVNFNNAMNPNYMGGTPQVFDGRSVLASEVYRWATHQSVDSSGQRTASLQWKTLAQADSFNLPGVLPQLPYGTHRIQWVIADGCGNTVTCEYEFTVKDAVAPTIACVDSVSVEIPFMLTDTVLIADLLQNAMDNYTPPPFLEYAARIAGTGAGFPVDGDSIFVYGCMDLGIDTVELWVQDLAGNTTFCKTVIFVEDADSSCTSLPLTVAGTLKTGADDAVLKADVVLSATHPAAAPVMLTTQPDTSGRFEFFQAVPIGSDYTLTPTKDINPLNGVSTFDLLLISRHILGLAFLDSPYKIIAADANHSESVTTFDIVEIRKLILGIYDQFPDNTSWRFVDKGFMFPNPANPFQSVFPESITRSNVLDDQLAEDFVGIKVGDVNFSVEGDSLIGADDRAEGTLFFNLNDRTVQRDEEFTVQFSTAEKVLGYQFTLNVDGLDVVEVMPGEGLELANFGVFLNAVTAAVENGAGTFAVTFRATRSGQLSEMLRVSSHITRAEAYRVASNDGNSDGAIALLDVALLFDNRLISKVGFELYQNQPNPFTDNTLIGFHLPEDSDATLSVFDETGRVLFTQSGSYPRGYNAVSLEKHLMGDAGVLFYKLETATDSAVRKMILLK